MNNKEFTTHSLETCLKAIEYAEKNDLKEPEASTVVLHNIFTMLSAIAVSLADIADKLTEPTEQEEA